MFVFLHFWKLWDVIVRIMYAFDDDDVCFGNDVDRWGIKK